MPKKLACIVPFYKMWENEDFFKKSSQYNFPYELKVKLESNDYEISFRDGNNFKSADVIILFRLDPITLFKLFLANALNRCIYIPFEPPVVQPLHTQVMLKVISGFIPNILTWQDNLVNKSNFHKYYFPVNKVKVDVSTTSYKQQKLITTIVGNKFSTIQDELYSERRKLITYLDKYHSADFDFYGTGWHVADYNCYQGMVDNKFDVLAKYKFCICYENQKNINGLISEKIFDAFNAGVVPIFWGAENITEQIPENTFIDRRKFSTDEGLVSFLKEMKETTYNEYLANIASFCQSNASQLFTAIQFAKSVNTVVTMPHKEFNINYKYLLYYLSQYFKTKLLRATDKISKKWFKF